MTGLQAPPPLFLGFWPDFLWSFGTLTSIFMFAGAVYWWEHPHSPLWIIWLTELVFLLPAGILALFARSPGQKYQFPSWDDDPPLSPEVLPPARERESERTDAVD
jgi:hypothetical protein